MVQDLHFTTKISGHTTHGLVLRGVALEELIEKGDFVSTFFLSMTGKLPKPAESFMLNAILTASIDHGIEPASGFVPRVVAASGNEVKTAMASTLLALGDFHGGAISAAMLTMTSIAQMKGDVEKNCQEEVTRLRAARQRISGYGHPVYTDVDPRAAQLFKLARQHKLDDTYLNLAEILENNLERTLNKKLVLNIDGAIAAILLTLGFPPNSGNAIFALARVAGSIAHILEEMTQPPVRRLESNMVEYMQ